MGPTFHVTPADLCIIFQYVTYIYPVSRLVEIKLFQIVSKREPLEIQTIQPEKNLKYSNELGYAGHMIPILISCKVIHHTLTSIEE